MTTQTNSPSQTLLDTLATLLITDIRTGTEAADLLVATNLLSFLEGLDGNDTLTGESSFDVLDGGNGDDLLTGNHNSDALFGGADADVLDGGKGKDVLFGGSGNDGLSGGDGRDTLDGGTGIDTLTGGAGRDDFMFSGPAFDAGTVISGDGVRQAVNTPDIVTDFAIGSDRFVFDAADFGVGARKFSSGFADEIKDGANMIILQSLDNDNNAATVFNAGAAASLIADNLDTDGAGFFVYFNQALQINRVVYSENLNDATSDIRVLANLTDLTGQAGIDALDDFVQSGFLFG